MSPKLRLAKRRAPAPPSAPRRVVGSLLVTAIGVLGAWQSYGSEFPEGRYALAFPAPPSSVQVSPDGRELLLLFPRPLPDGAAERAAKSMGTLVEGYAEGYGAVRFRLSTPITAALASSTVTIVPQPDPAPNREDERRLALLQARIEARDGDVAGATAQLRRIAADRPEDIEPLLTLAEVETGAGRWQHAIGLYDGLGRLFPEAADIAGERTGLSYRHGPAVRLDGSATFGPNGERAQSSTLQGDLPLGEFWRAGLSLQAEHDAIRGLRRSGAATAADYGDTKLLAGLSVSHDWQSPTDTTRLDLFTAPRTLGFGLKHDVTTSLGQTALGASYHQPYWGTVMSFAANARRDQVGVAQTIPLPDQWQLQVGGGLVRYGLPGNDDVASGPTALAGISRLLPERWLPLSGMQLRLGYRLEAEYLSRAATGPTGAGPLPLLDVREREVHSLYAETTTPLGPGTATGLLGYAIDRFGGGGPQALLRYSSGEDTDRLTVSAEAGIEPSLDIQPRTLFHIGFFAVWRFGGA